MDFDGSNILSFFFGTVYGFIVVFAIVAVLLVMICQCKMFKAAGKPWWAALVPIYNTYNMCQITYGDRLGWVAVVMILSPMVPLIGAIVSFILNCHMSYCYAKAYGKSDLAAILYVLFAPIMLLVWVASGDYEYYGPQDNFISRKF